MSAGARADLTKRARRAKAAAEEEEDDDQEEEDEDEDAAGGGGDIPPPLRAARSVLLHARALPRRADERGRAAGRVRYVAYGEGPEAACGGAVCSVEEL